MNKKGLTLVELLAVIVVISIIITIAVVSVNYITSKGKLGVYKNYEDNLKGSAELYLLENSELLPNEPNNEGEYNSIKITYADLTNGLFMEKIKDPDGGECSNSYVIVKRKVNVGNNYNLEYLTCLICDNYKTNLEECN